MNEEPKTGLVVLASKGGPYFLRLPPGRYHVMAFVDEELARAFLATSVESFLSPVPLQAAFGSWSEKDKEKLAALYFQTPEDVALFQQDPAGFPYGRFSIPFVALEPGGTDYSGAAPRRV